MSSRLLGVAAAVAALIVLPAGASAAAGPDPRPAADHLGGISYSTPMPLTLHVSDDGTRLQARPGYFREPGRCSGGRGWRGAIETDALSDTAWMPIRKGGFDGRGRAQEPFSSSSPYRFRATWTLRGRFTSPTTASGTIRIGGDLRARGGTVLRCAPITVPWRTTGVAPR